MMRDATALPQGCPYLVQRLDSAVASGGPVSTLEDLEQRLQSLYRGPLLPGETGAWALPARERLRGRFLHALEQLGRHYEEAADWTRALRCYRSGLHTDPLAESLYLRLMYCYRGLGQPAEVLAVYRRCRQTLASLLGVSPSREIEDLAGSLRPANR